MTTPTNRIPIEEADLPTLKHFAETLLGIDVKDGTNLSQLRAKIGKAAPELKDVPPIPAPPAPVVQQAAPAEEQAPAIVPARIDPPATAAKLKMMHQANDPRCEVKIAKSAEKHRSKDVTLSINGVTCRLQRGVWIDVPYRIYECLNNAVERVQVPGDEINPMTGEPYYVWEQVHSYPFEARKLPDDDALKAWHDAVDDGFQQPAATAQAA